MLRSREDGSAILSKQEFDELNKAYQGMYDILSGMPTSIGDYFVNYENYMNVVKWHCELKGEEFCREDWE